MGTRRVVSAVLLATAAVTLAYYHQVDNRLRPADRVAIAAYFAAVGYSPPASLESYALQLAYIRAVQQAVLHCATGNDGIPQGFPREPADLLRRGSGLCYDRSRVIEKMLRFGGLQTRHCALYHRAAGASALQTLIDPHSDSHAVTEVRTSAGWLVVDSNEAWLSLDCGGRPQPIAAVHTWQRPLPAFYRQPFVCVYGLYSRHGRFYPPYNAVPDLHWPELLANVW